MKQKIAVFCGGISPERDVSLVSGKNVAEALSKNFETALVRLDKNELPTGLNPEDTVVYPAMHGDYGENGELQRQLEEAGFSYAGCQPLSSRVCMVKPAAKALLKSAGLRVAKSLEFSAQDKPTTETLFELFPKGVVIKPADKTAACTTTSASTPQALRATNFPQKSRSGRQPQCAAPPKRRSKPAAAETLSASTSSSPTNKPPNFTYSS